MPFLVLIFLILMVVVGYFAQLNPERVTFLVTRDQSYDISLTALILFSVAAGGLLVMITSGVRQTKALYLNWTYRKQQKKITQVEDTHKAGVNAFLSKRYKEAIEKFEKVLTMNPNHVNTLLRLGEIYRSQKKYPEAIQLHRRAKMADNQNTEVLLQLACDLEAARAKDEAVLVLKEIVHRDESNLTALIHLRDIYVRLSSWEEAHAIQEKIVKLPLSDEMRAAEQATLMGIKFEKGIVLLGRNQTDPARKAFKSAIKMNKHFLPAYVSLGEVYVKEGRIAPAMTFFEKGYEITQNLILLHRLEELCLELGQPDRILQAYQKALSKNPTSMALKFYLGKLYYRLEMVDEASDLLYEIEGQVHHFPDLHKILGNLYLRRGEFRQAAEAFRKGLDLKTAVVVPYYCSLCDYQTTRWSGRCAKCGQWNSYETTPLITDKEQKREIVPVSLSSLQDY